MSDCIAYDSDGTIMQRYTINTICPIRYLPKAREIALMHLLQVEGRINEKLADMLPDKLYDIHTNSMTHVMCSRNGYDNTIRNQIATMEGCFLSGDEWVSDRYYYIEDMPDVSTVKSKFCFILGDRRQVLDYLGLEVR